ncbi:Asp23/Gls24 family envelope stress response protein [Cryobacterium sp. Sr8]|uniref:Uncharacterized conserved protein YloU, alkaline shock protein (Asp23) family n=1 Tax=Cryobacterium psychrotolerans TaxID=386301 RepID=A0A1G9FST2_9MICO|nr:MULTISPECIES: Asp23/Gls24 family envelope stress response protein [Cryobacterium]TFD47124.1 Asp23/Gls24 family envelope stress response protein [Cryobacterium sp. TMT1-2-1]TFD75280.1 Asp23/Gls24 family envelope stress response protein [Cryobacterium sp. Sr8]TFD90611.1 Asp23/Gls24 family envelope stress response protein [Cryobacterium psychrotolerans]SDK91402.1 Uncharacterized conserved protein YloU, alkaline shock protein (Asp23) family [Cryobacterium psychrotolerans]
MSDTTTSSASHTQDSGTGKTTIENSVVAKVAGIAAKDVAGVYALGGGAQRVVGAIRGLAGAESQSQGISVEVGETQVAVDVTMVAEYPLPLQDLAERVRQSVIRAIETIVGMEVTEVNVTINDVHIPADDDDDTEKRVQ